MTNAFGTAIAHLAEGKYEKKRSTRVLRNAELLASSDLVFWEADISL